MAPKRNLRSGVVLAAIIASLSLIVPREAAATGGISGRIAGPNGEPLAGVEVQAFVGRPFLTPWSRDMFLGFPFRTGPVAWTQTGADGRYELTGLEPTLEPSCDANNGWYMLVVSPSPQTGFTPRVLPGNITGLPARPLVVEEGKTLTGIDIRLGPPGRIAGTVTGPDGAPLADTWVGADIQTSSFRPEWLPRRATTDGLGRFVLTGLEDDAYFVKVTPPGTSMWDLYYPGASDPVPIRPILGEVTGGNDITVPTPGLLEVNSENYTAWSFTSGPEEYYLSPKYLPPGDYRIGVAMSQDLMDNTYYPSTFQWEDASPVAIKPGEITSVTMSQTPLGTAHGKVVDGAGAPVGGVDVNVSTACGTTHKARTNSFGDFSVSSSGDRKLQFSKQGYSTTWLDGKPDETSADVVRFRSGETVTLPTVVLQSLGTPGSIAGRVTAVGAPFKGFVEVWTARDAAVALRDPAGASPLRTGLTNPDGSYEVTALSPGSYLLLFEGSTFGARWYPAAVSPWTATPVVVEAGLQTTGIDADLALTGSISGTVTLDHQPLPTVAKVCLTDVAGHMLRCVSGTIDNTYSFDGVAPGTYLLAFDSDQSFSWGKWYPFEDTM
ncbi:MAG TPA: carboxypeptidase-like regulatory domain-containing protein, partial [Geobacteraceae bacterium]